MSVIVAHLATKRTTCIFSHSSLAKMFSISSSNGRMCEMGVKELWTLDNLLVSLNTANNGLEDCNLIRRASSIVILAGVSDYLIINPCWSWVPTSSSINLVEAGTEVVNLMHLCNHSLTLQPEESVGQGSSPFWVPPFEGQEKGSWTRLGLLYYCCDPSNWHTNRDFG